MATRRSRFAPAEQQERDPEHRDRGDTAEERGLEPAREAHSTRGERDEREQGRSQCDAAEHEKFARDHAGIDESPARQLRRQEQQLREQDQTDGVGDDGACGCAPRRFDDDVLRREREERGAGEAASRDDRQEGAQERDAGESRDQRRKDAGDDDRVGRESGGDRRGGGVRR